MNDLLTTLPVFFLHHWILTLLFIIILAAIIYMETKGAGKGVKKVSPQQAVHLINKENALIVDIRDKAAYQAGHIVNAIHVPPSEVIEHKKISANKTTPILLVCANGMPSPALAAKLFKQGHSAVYYLGGGINTWKAEHLPLVK